jgi:hypothetical protein
MLVVVLRVHMFQERLELRGQVVVVKALLVMLLLHRELLI